jgi:hypothetical protein
MKKPIIDVTAAAKEIEKYLESKKFDLIDFGYVQIECYPPSDSDEYPEIRKFSKAWADFFDKSDEALTAMPDDLLGKMKFSEVLTKFDPNLAEDLAVYDKLADEVAKTVNDDAAFWCKLRDAVIPLYEKSPHYEQWKQRWKAISLAYDPMGMDVKTTQMWTNKKTGERIRGEVLRTTSYPPGFILKVL